MHVYNFEVPDLLALYAEHYDTNVIRWRSLAASDKAGHIDAMFKSQGGRPRTVLEVGCGTGAVLAKLADRWAGSSFTGIEIGDERPQSALERKAVGNLTILGYDGKRIPFEDASFDLAYATHVLEHVTDERGFLLELRRVSQRYIYVEVPLELHLRTSYKDLQASLAIGHINAYSFRSFALTLETSGLRVIKADIFDHSYQLHRFYNAGWKAAIKMALRRSLLSANKQLASQFFTYHAGALCEKSVPLNIA